MYILRVIFPKKFHHKLENSLYMWIFIALVLRLFLMVFSIHSDFFFIHMFPNLLVSHGVWNIYKLFATDLTTQSGFYYTPTVFYFFSLVQFMLHPLVQEFGGYMDKAYSLYKFGALTPLDYINSIKINYFYIFFLMKLPYLIFDIGILFIILRMVKTWQNAKKSFLLWLFNPVVLYGTYAYAQFDIIPTFLLLLGVYFCFKNKIILGMLVIGIAATFKNFALFAVLPIAFSLGKNIKERFYLSLLGFSPFLISIAIVFLQASTQAIYTIIPKFYFAKISTSTSIFSLFSRMTRYLSFGLVYFLVLLFSIYGKVDIKEKVIGLSLISLISLFAFSPVILFHYVTILLPLLIIYLVGEKWFSRLFFLYIFSIAIFKLWTPTQQLGLFAPINSSFFYLPSTSTLVSHIFPYSYLSSFFYYIFFGLSIFFVIKVSFKLVLQSK